MITACFAVVQNNPNIVGRIVSTKGDAVPGAVIHVLNTNIHVQSDDNGEFKIDGLADGDYDLQVRATGYISMVRKVTFRSTANPITIVLKELGEEIEEVMVTAQKRDESQSNLALSISAFSADRVSDYRLLNIKDITAIVPNLYMANPGDNRNVTSIRGITTTSYDPAVATYIDGVNQFGLDTYFAQLYDIERIEVLRGPQGTLYGRNAMGGVINIVTKQPDNRPSGFVNMDFGNYGMQRYSVGLRSPIIKNKLFFGAAVLFDKHDGYFKNEYNGQHFDKQHSFSGNYYLKYLANTDWSFVLNVKHAANRNRGAFPLAGSMEDALEQPYLINQDKVTRMVDNIFNSSLSINYTGKSFNFLSQSAYQSNYRFYEDPIDADFSPIDLYAQVNNYGRDWNTVSVATQEFRFSSPASSSRLTWLAGLYSFYASSPTKLGLRFGEQAGLIGIPPEMINSTSINTTTGENFGIAGFAHGSFSLSDRLDLMFGLRYDVEHRKLTAGEELEDQNQNVVTIIPSASESERFHAVTPKLALKYQLKDLTSLYGSFTKGFRAGGIDWEDGGFYSFDPEYSNNFEIGSKNYFFNNRLRVNVSLFYTTVNNAQLPTLVLPEGLVVTKNAGKLRSKGIELEGGLIPVKDLEVDYSVGFTHARYMEDLSPRQIYTPNVTSMLALRYQYSINPDFKVLLRGEWKHIGDQYFDLENTLKQQAYHLFNARITFATRYGDLSIWGANLTERRYVDYAYDFGAAHLAAPRTYGLTIRKQL